MNRKLFPTSVLVAAPVILGSVAALAMPLPSLAADTPKPHVVTPADSSNIDTNVTCGPAATNPVPDGQPIVVSMPPGPNFTVGQIPATWWKTPPYGDAGWQLHLRGFMWVHPLAQRAYQDHQTESLSALVAQVVAFHRQNPDPGTSTAATTANANKWGWDEGTALRRLGAENCLYSLTQDARLVPGMQADAAVQYGPRFYGPPKYIVHNHGVMADLAVVRAGDLLKRTDWQTRSINRLVADAPKAWTPAGVTIEQSSSYHLLNVSLWREVVDVVTAHRGATNPSAKQVAALVGRANSIIPWLSEPQDHRIVVIGDSNRDAGQTRTTWITRMFHDNASGFAVGRWSWSDPNTTYYTVRYGPKRTAHGQQDRPGATWTTLGQEILVNPGKAPYDTAGNFRAWALGLASHNIATADRRKFVDAPVALTATSSKATWQSWTTADTLFGIKHTRTITAIGSTPRGLVDTDTYASSAAFHQFWHLAPAWTLATRSADGKKLTFKSGKHVLAVTTTGTATVYRGVTRPMAGWNFPTPDTHVSAAQIQVAAKGTARTSFTVS